MTNTEKAPEGKVWASTVGGTAGLTISVFTLWVLGVTLWHQPTAADAATSAVAAVPSPVSAFVGLLITVGGVFIGGYLAKHTPRLEEVLQAVELHNTSLSVDETYEPDVNEEDGNVDQEPESNEEIVDVDQSIDSSSDEIVPDLNNDNSEITPGP